MTADTLSANLDQLNRSGFSGFVVRQASYGASARRPLARPWSAPPEAISQYPTSHGPLTAREDDVMQLLAKGYRNKELAAALNISEDTVLTHMKSSFLKLGVDDRTEAVVNSVRLGLAHLD